MDKEEELKEQYLSWLNSIKIRRLAYEQSKRNVKHSEEQLKNSKRILNLTYKNWKQARKEAERTKRKWKAYPYKLRKWGKENMDKVFNLMEKD